jgi:hypothetical protein
LTLQGLKGLVGTSTRKPQQGYQIQIGQRPLSMTSWVAPRTIIKDKDKELRKAPGLDESDSSRSVVEEHDKEVFQNLKKVIHQTKETNELIESIGKEACEEKKTSRLMDWLHNKVNVKRFI